MMPMGADPEAPTTEDAEPRVADARDGIAVGALAVFTVSATAAGLCVSWALGFAALAIAALVVAFVIGLR